MGRARSLDETAVVVAAARSFLAAVHLVGSDRLTAVEELDLLLVALLEVAVGDASVRELVQGHVDRLPTAAAQLLGARLLERAGVQEPDQPTTRGTP